MSKFYKARKTWGIFDPSSKDPFKVSRSKIDLFIQCERCFYLDARLGVKRPSFPAFTLNSAVDFLLKNEFDLLRKKGESHELMKRYGIDAVPFDHKDLPIWRDDAHRYTGAKVLFEEGNLIVDGLVDDIWINKNAELMIVDYKATSTSKEISLEDEWKAGYKRQMEIYQWIFRHLSFKVSDTGYFVFANAAKNRPSFDGKLEFEMSIIPHKGDDSWVSETLLNMKKCLISDNIPNANQECEYCNYRENAGLSFREIVLKNKAVKSPVKVPISKKQ